MSMRTVDGGQGLGTGNRDWGQGIGQGIGIEDRD